MMRWILLLLIFVAGVGLYRGWLSFSRPSDESQTSKVNVTVSVDTEKLQSDILAAKQRVDAAIGGQNKPSETASTAAPWLR